MTKKPYRLRRSMAARFRRLRKRQGLTQLELAALLDFDRTEVIHIEKCRRYPQYSTLERFEELEQRAAAGKKLEGFSQ